MKSHSLLFLIFFLLVTILGCQSSLKEGDVIEFINNENIQVNEIIPIDGLYFLFCDDNNKLGIYTIKNKNNGTYEYSHAKSDTYEKIFLGSSEKNYVGLIVNDKELLNKTNYIQIEKNEKKDKIPLSKDKKYYVLNSSLITKNYDYVLKFYDINNEIIYQYGPPENP